MAALDTIEGIGPVTADKLKTAGVTTIASLLQKGATKKGRKTIAEESGIDEARVLKFVNHADLMRIKGVGGEYAELLEATGVDTVPELSRRNPANLHSAMVETNEDKALVRSVASLKQVEGWVEQAKELERAVEY